MAGLATRRALWLLALSTLVFGLAALPALGTMSDRGTGVIAFELARSSARAAQIVGDWGAEGRSAARESLWLDYPFLLSYGLLLAGGCWAVARRFTALGRPRAAALGGAFGWAGLAAAGLDAVENVALLRVASEHVQQPWPGLAFVAATLKFALSTVAGLFAVGGWLATRRRRGAPPPKPPATAPPRRR